MRGEVVYLYSFDVANEIRTTKIQEIMSQKPFPFVIRMDRTLPRDVPLYRPLAIELPALTTTFKGQTVQPMIRVYDAGVVSVILRVPFKVNSPLDLLTWHEPQLDSGEQLVHVAQKICENVCRSLADLIDRGTPPHAPEAYTMFCVADLLPKQTTLAHWMEQEQANVAALLAETQPGRLSPTQITETLRVQSSFENTDLVVVDWDAAFVVDLSGYFEDVIFVLELANIQLEEFWVMDGQLDAHLNEAYTDLEQAQLRLFGRSNAILKKLRRLRIDFARLTDEVTHISKFIGDWHLARVYLGARERFHLDEWRDSVEHRLGQLDQLYGVVHSEIYERRMYWLEIAIVVMFAIDIIALLLGKA